MDIELTPSLNNLLWKKLGEKVLSSMLIYINENKLTIRDGTKIEMEIGHNDTGLAIHLKFVNQ